MKAVCVQCGSRKWRKDDSGGYICQFGHQLGIHEETHEDNEATMHSQRRTVKKKKERLTSEEPEEAPPSFMSLIEFQTLLQQQMNWIIDTKKLPSQTKTVVRDLWLIYVAQSGVQIQLRAWHTLSMIALGMRVLDTPYQVGTILSWVLEGMPYFIRERRHEIQMRTIPNTKTIRKGLLHIFKICNLKPEMLFCLPSLAYHLMELLHMPNHYYPQLKLIFYYCESLFHTRAYAPEHILSAVVLMLAKTIFTKTHAPDLPLVISNQSRDCRDVFENQMFYLTRHISQSDHNSATKAFKDYIRVPTFSPHVSHVVSNPISTTDVIVHYKSNLLEPVDSIYCSHLMQVSVAVGISPERLDTTVQLVETMLREKFQL